MTADVVNSNRKAQLLSTTVEHVAIDQYDARPVIDAMRQMSFTSRDTARAADILSLSLEDAGCSHILVEAVPESEAWSAARDRLARAAAKD